MVEEAVWRVEPVEESQGASSGMGPRGGERKEVELQPREAALGHSPDMGQPITQAGYSSSPP